MYNEHIKKIAFIGPECTGKTTLCNALAETYHTVWVPEYMRTYLQRKWDEGRGVCEWDDLLPIAEGQLRTEREAMERAEGFLFCDTCLLELVVYSYLYYGKCDSWIEEEAMRQVVGYDRVFLTYVDVPWVADDLRDKPNERQEVFDFFRRELNKRGVLYEVIKGTLEERKTVVKHLITNE